MPVVANEMPVSISCHVCKRSIKPEEIIVCAGCAGKAAVQVRGEGASIGRSVDRSFCTLCSNSGWVYVEGSHGAVKRCRCKSPTRFDDPDFMGGVETVDQRPTRKSRARKTSKAKKAETNVIDFKSRAAGEGQRS